MNFLTHEGRVNILIKEGYIDAGALVQGMKSLGYEIDRRQINQMIDYLGRQDERKGVITKDAFKKFMSAKMHINDPENEIRAAF